MYACSAAPPQGPPCAASGRESLVYSVTLTHTRFSQIGASEDYLSRSSYILVASGTNKREERVSITPGALVIHSSIS